MKRFLIKIAIFGFLIIVVDFCIGAVCKYLQYNTKGGYTGRVVYIADKMNEDILIFGSSRAMRHYNPQIIEDSLGLSCYNCGRSSQGIIFMYGQYRQFCERYTPKVIIYDIYPKFDLIDEYNNEKYLSWLRFYYDRPGIDSIFYSIDATEKYKMLSNMRIFNEKFLGLISDWIIPNSHDNKGFYPLNKTMAYEPKIEVNGGKQLVVYDNLKLYYWHRLISDCKSHGTQLILAVSPFYKADSTDVFNPLIEIAKNENIPIIYHYNDIDINLEKKYFKDSRHLNAKGADAYTKKIIKELRNIINF